MSDLFRNHYRCPECIAEWDDAADCTCNDRCPECGDEIEPYRSDELDPETGEPVGGNREPLACPFCGEEDISSGELESDYEAAWRSCTCKACGREWTETFRFVGWKEDK